jgi:hypothetical protein
MIPNTGPIITPRTIKKAISGIPVLLKKLSPATPRKIVTPAAKRTTWAAAIESCPAKPPIASCKLVNP